MRKAFSVTTLFSLLVGCANPYANYSKAQLAVVDEASLCHVATSKFYEPSTIVFKEISKRGIRECSSGELYCRKIGLRYGTSQYASCRLQYQQYELNAVMAEAAIVQQNEQIRIQRQAVNNQFLYQTRPFRNTMHCNTQYSGLSAHTDCY